jgi:hypothetical protein
VRVLTVGDSFTYGEELADLTSAWPSLLSNKLGYQLNNLAKPGSGNMRMVRHAIEQVNNYDIVIIAWSHFARIELADENGFYDLWPGGGTLPHKAHSPWRWEVINYFTKHHNDDYLYRQYLLNIILIQNYLKANNKKYIMLDSFGNHQANERAATTNKDLLDQIDKTYYVGWPDSTMMEWAYLTPVGPHGHFLEEGHIKVAEKIYNHMDQLLWLV